ncbi:MAG: AAA family ATPase [Kineosporiaceae bacterium]
MIENRDAARAALIVLAGLPGVGKTQIARGVADRLGATFLRIDTIESAIASTLHPFRDNPVGYVIAARVAADQLRSGRRVVADAVNGLQLVRDLWAGVAREGGARLHWVEVICSDRAEHRRRVESRSAEMPGHELPTWQQVLDREWHPFVEPHLVIDNLGDPQRHIEAVVAALG